MSNPSPMNSRCGLTDCDCEYTIEQLETRVEEAEAFRKDVQEYRDFWLAKYDEVTMKHADVEGRLVVLAERFATSLHYKDVHELHFKDCPYLICQEARNAIKGVKS